ncbi:MAG: PA14 domain-containing protein [Bacteroidota bacterium]
MFHKYQLYWLVLASLFFSCQEEITKAPDYPYFPTASHLNPKVEGFEVQSIQEGEGEWLSIAKDPQGRLLVSPRRGNLLRFTLPKDSTQNLKIDTLDIGVNDCQGLLYAYGQLYMMGQNIDTIRGVYRVPDTDGKGNYGTPILMKEIPKNGDHSGHTLALGPEGAIYFLSGNENRPPKGEGVSYVYEDWRNDHLMPLASIFGVSQTPPGGYVLRTDSVGSHWQLLAYGLRNPYDMCFSPEGELFTFDSDMEWDFNLPWYRPTRVNHLVSGGDYAWRQSTAKRFDYYPDILPALEEFGRGSPTATLFGAGAAFPEKYQKALFLGDWSYGKIYAMHLEPDGASYQASYEPFITGQPLNITDMIVGEDGALYFTTGGNGTDTGLFRVTYNGEQSVKQVEKAEAPHPNLVLRRELEQFHFLEEQAGLSLALEHVGHEDRFVRNAAKTILERNRPELWLEAFQSANNTDAVMTLTTALIRSDSTDQYQNLVFQKLDELNYAKLDEKDQLGILRLYALALVRAQLLPTEKIPAIYNKFISFYPAESDDLNKELSRLLGFLAKEKGEGSEMIAKTFDLLESTSDPVQFVHYLEMMRLIPKGWTLEQRGAYRHWMKYAKANLTGGSLFKYFLTEIEKEFEATMSEDEIAWLDSHEEQPLKKGYEGPVKPKPKVAQSVFEPSAVSTNWKMEDLQYGLELVSSPRDASIRDFNRGQKMFAKGQCYNCHYMINKGGGFGPEMTLAGNSFSAEDLLMAILEPSKDINSRFQSTVFKMKDGGLLAGRMMTEDKERYVIQASFDPASTQEVPKKRVKSFHEANYSDMPAGLINSMSREEVMDLLYFIIQVASKGEESLEIGVFENKGIFEQGDSSLVEMINFSKRGEIYYTLDGSEPDAASERYETPFFVTESTVIRAKSIEGIESSEIVTRQLHAVNREENGLEWKLYRDVLKPFQLEDNRKADASGVAYSFDVRPIAEGENNFELHYEGYLEIEEAGEYTFYTQQDDAMKFYLDGQLFIDASKKWWKSSADDSIYLSAGKHSIRVEFFENVASEFLGIQYESNRLSKRDIPSDRLFRKRQNI